jgi:hypothetical protein
MRQDLTEIPARREDKRESQNEGEDDFQAPLSSVTLISKIPKSFGGLSFCILSSKAARNF